MTVAGQAQGAGNGRDARPPAIFLMGPTASGKTGLAALPKFPGRSAPIQQVYRGLDIGSAK